MLVLDKNSAALIQYPAPSISRNPKSNPAANQLRHQKDFVGVRVFHFRSWGKSFHVDVLAGRIRAFHQVRFARNWNSVGIISLCHLRRSGRGRRRCGPLFSGRSGLGGSVRIERLLWRGILPGRGWRIICDAMPGGLRWWFFGTRRDEEHGEQGKQHKESHKWK